MAASGVSYLKVSINNRYTHLIQYLYQYILSKMGNNRISHVEIDPHSRAENIRFYLNTDGANNNINIGDSFDIYGGSASWIVD